MKEKFLIEYYGWYERRGCGQYIPATKIVKTEKEVRAFYKKWIEEMYESDNEELIQKFKAYNMIEVPADYYL